MVIATDGMGFHWGQLALLVLLALILVLIVFLALRFIRGVRRGINESER